MKTTIEYRVGDKFAGRDTFNRRLTSKEAREQIRAMRRDCAPATVSATVKTEQTWKS